MCSMYEYTTPLEDEMCSLAVIRLFLPNYGGMRVMDTDTYCRDTGHSHG